MGVWVIPWWLYVVALAAAYAGLRVWGRQVQDRYSLAQLVSLPWWQWLFARYVISLDKREANHDLWEWCGYDEEPRWPTYITVRGWARKGWRFYRLGQPVVIVRVARGFPQDDEDEIMSARGHKLSTKRVVVQARGTLDLGPVDADWKWRLAMSHVILTPQETLPPPPRWADRHVRETLRPALGPMIWPHGLGVGARPVTRSRKTDNPHLAISGGTGAGKSTALLWYAANTLHFGGLVVICDIKRHSHVWARDLPGVLSFPDVRLDPESAPPAAKQINDAIVHVMAEVDRRNRECDPLRAGDPFPEFQPVLLVLDELNPTMTAMNQWWKNEGRRTTRDGDRAPGTHALQTFLHQGRAVCMSAVFGFHAARRNAVGGGEGFEDIGNFLMIPPYSKQTWNVVAPHLEFIPARSHHANPAWGVLIDSMDAVELQRPLMTDLEAVRFARVGDAKRAEWRDSPEIGALKALGNGQPRRPEPTTRVEVAIEAAHSNGSDPGTSGAPDDFDIATLREFSLDEGAGTIDMRYDALRKAADKPDFPEPAIDHDVRAKRKYLRQDVERWLANRGEGDPGVYVIEPPHDLKVKIGETMRLDARIDEFSWSGLGRKVVKHWFPCRTKQHAQALEDWFRDKYGDSNIPGTEWHVKEGPLAEDLYDDDRMLAGCPEKLMPEVART